MKLLFNLFIVIIIFTLISKLIECYRFAKLSRLHTDELKKLAADLKTKQQALSKQVKILEIEDNQLKYRLKELVMKAFDILKE